MELKGIGLEGDVYLYSHAGEGLLVGPDGPVLVPVETITDLWLAENQELRPATQEEAEGFAGWGEQVGELANEPASETEAGAEAEA